MCKGWIGVSTARGRGGGCVRGASPCRRSTRDTSRRKQATHRREQREAGAGEARALQLVPLVGDEQHTPRADGCRLLPVGACGRVPAGQACCIVCAHVQMASAWRQRVHARVGPECAARVFGHRQPRSGGRCGAGADAARTVRRPWRAPAAASPSPGRRCPRCMAWSDTSAAAAPRRAM
jgi:hypothetical protein